MNNILQILGMLFFSIGMITFFVGIYIVTEVKKNEALKERQRFFAKLVIWSMSHIALGVLIMMIGDLLK